MASSIYTLLIVESPVIAGIIQKLTPSSVYVVATGGYCWRPKYDPERNRLTPVADPAKRELRKELKQQGEWAGNVVLATDQDPSGDFIAWSVAGFLNRPDIKRSRLQNLSRNGIRSMLEDARSLDTRWLENRLKNHFMIRHLWKNTPSLPDFYKAGLAAVFGTSRSYRHFLDETGILYKSPAPLRCDPSEWIPVRPVSGEPYYVIHQPLSTFDIPGPAVRLGLAGSFREAQMLLERLFQTVLQFSDESLISYPRTAARAFYSETWNTIRSQYMQFGPLSDLKPAFLQEIAPPDAPHESIHPLNLRHTPETVSGELPGEMAGLYRWIYRHTLSGITMPVNPDTVYTNELYPDSSFYPVEGEQVQESSFPIRPCFTTGDLGMNLSDLGICKPSSFGRLLDEWVSNEWIHINNDVVVPGTPIKQMINRAGILHSLLSKLNRAAGKRSLSRETVEEIFSSS